MHRALVVLTLALALSLARVVAAADAPLRFSTVEGAGGVPLNVVDAGDPAKPAILLIHGIGQSYLSWENQLRAPLTDEFHVVAFDLRGHGNSGKPWNGEAYQNSRNWADDVQRIIDAQKLDRPVLVGWSYGSLVVADYVRAYGTAKLRGIVLTGALGGFTPPPPPPPPALTDAMKTWSQSAVAPDIAANLAAADQGARRLVAHEMPAAWYERTAKVSLLLPGYARKWMFQRSLANSDLVPQLRVPVLLIKGGKDFGMPADQASELATQVRGGKLLVYPESGHSPFAEEPERFTQDLAAFSRDALRPQAARPPKSAPASRAVRAAQ